jgi:hypothetical protein
MLAWMLYMITVALLLSAGAWIAERAARLNRGRSRWIWLVAIGASLCAPIVVDTVRDWRAGSDAVQAPATVTRDPRPLAATVSPTIWIAAVSEKPGWWQDHDAWLRRLWCGTSALTLLLLLGGYLHLRLRMRRWRPASVAGVAVLLSSHAGPAVVGVLRPRIVVPDWLTRAPRSHQLAIIAHEQSHLAAGDVRLFALALAMLVIVPWNLPLWWQLHRLRRAIEIDCDARVLDGGIDAASYGETLISAGERQSAQIAAMAATSGSRSFLEQRIRIMISKPIKWRRSATAALAGASLCIAALAAQVSTPGPSESHAARATIQLPTNILDRYVGDYAQSDNTFVTVRRNGDRLLVDLSSGPRFELVAESEDHFMVQGANDDAQMIFANDGSNKAPSAALRQMGKDLPLQRVDAATVAEYRARLQARLQVQTPAPGTEATLRRLYAGIEAGSPNYAEMQPLLAEAVRRDLPKLMARYRRLGPVQSIEFAGVDGGGFDIYEVARANGRQRDSIIVAGDGKIAGYFSTDP